MSTVITLTTDFGTAGPYVAAMKGAVLSVNPDARIVDVSHEISPQNVDEAAFVLAAAYPYFPAGCIHVAVVDPDVGALRRAIALVAPAGVFVGPDNGVLSCAVPDTHRLSSEGGPAALPRGFAAYAIDPRFHRHPVSDTFHGRDVFAPAAAHLSLGARPPELGPALSEIVLLPPFRAVLRPDGALTARRPHRPVRQRHHDHRPRPAPGFALRVGNRRQDGAAVFPDLR